MRMRPRWAVATLAPIRRCTGEQMKRILMRGWKKFFSSHLSSSLNLTLSRFSFTYTLFRPISGRSNFRSPNSATRFTRSPRGVANNGFCATSQAVRPTVASTTKPVDGKSTSSVQTDISALPHQWRSETQLSGGEYSLSGFTLPSTSKFNPQRSSTSRCGKNLKWVWIIDGLFYMLFFRAINSQQQRNLELFRAERKELFRSKGLPCINMKHGSCSRCSNIHEEAHSVAAADESKHFLLVQANVKSPHAADEA